MRGVGHRKHTALLCAGLLMMQGQAQAYACDESELQPLLERFAVATTLPVADCVREVTAVGGDEFWQGECGRIEASPDAATLREHGRRMSIQVAEMQTNDAGATAVIVNLHGPDILALYEALERQKQCRLADDDGKSAGRIAAPDLACGAWSWADIPVIDRYGAIPLMCKSGKWALISPNASSDYKWTPPEGGERTD